VNDSQSRYGNPQYQRREASRAGGAFDAQKIHEKKPRTAEGIELPTNFGSDFTTEGIE